MRIASDPSCRAVCPINQIGTVPFFDFSKYALNIGGDPSTGAAIELPGHGPFLS
jgi:hypothetical protein